MSGPRLRLRPLTLADVNSTYVDWLNDRDVNRYLETRYSQQTLASIAAYVKMVTERADERLFAICLNDGGRHIGNIKLGPIKAPHPVADISLFIGARECWGKGYATEAIRLVIEHAFVALDLAKVSAGFYARNVASMRAFERAGFSVEGTRRRHYRLGDELSDIVLMGLCRDEWRGAGS